jgi:hypothetical protein
VGPPDSDRITRVPSYSGYSLESPPFRIQGFHLLWPDFPICSSIMDHPYASPTTPRLRTNMVWALSRSLAATCEISIDYFSYRYLDVSVPCVRLIRLLYSPHD